jgi:hypothetical protein
MMTKRNFKCPVCGKPLSQTEYDKALGLWAEKQEHIQHLEAEQKQLRDQARRDREKVEAERRKLQQQAQAFKSEQAKLRAQNKKALAEQAQKAEQLLRQQREQIEKTMQRRMKTQIQEGVNKGIAQQKNEFKKKENKMKQLENSLKLSASKYEQANDEIRRLKEQIEKGLTPQIEGLLEEKTLLAKLTELFPRDKFEHLGKGGDIIQIVIEQGREIGRIVYECKKVKHFDKKHIEQAKEARRIRHADFAVLVTNAFPSKKQYYFVEKTVFVISPVSLQLLVE